MKMMKLLLPVLFLTGCSTLSVTQLTLSEPLPKGCEVQIFSEKSSAVESGGTVSEMCLVQTSANAVSSVLIDRAKPGVCKCGASKAYIKTIIEPSAFQAGTVTLVGFK